MKAGFCGLIGLPNAGKSSLMNWLISEKVSIVTPKPQTTRRRILGLWTSEQGQIVFADAPGLIRAAKGLNRFLEAEMKEVVSDSDSLIVVLNVDEESKEALKSVIEVAKSSGKPWIAVINKLDLHDKAHRAIILEGWVNEMSPGIRIFKVSTKEKNEELRREIIEAVLAVMPEAHGHLYDADIVSPQSTREIVAEMIREQGFLNLHQEVPYGLAVQIQKYDEGATPTRIYADLLVSKTNFKPMVIGQGGQMIKKIGQGARERIQEFLGEKIHLELNVVVKEGWTENAHWMKELGYFHDES